MVPQEIIQKAQKNNPEHQKSLILEQVKEVNEKSSHGHPNNSSIRMHRSVHRSYQTHSDVSRRMVDTSQDVVEFDEDGFDAPNKFINLDLLEARIVQPNDM